MTTTIAYQDEDHIRDLLIEASRLIGERSDLPSGAHIHYQIIIAICGKKYMETTTDLGEPLRLPLALIALAEDKDTDVNKLASFDPNKPRDSTN